MENNKALTMTVFIKATANYGESLGNVAMVQKVFRNGKVYAVRTKESMKYAIGAQSGLSDGLQIKVDGAAKKDASPKNTAQKDASPKNTAQNQRWLEAGYMTTAKGGTTYTRNSSFYLTDAVSCDPFVIEPRFANNLNLARTSAKQQGININEDKNATKCGLMPYQFEHDLSLKKYSITIDLDRIGTDENFPGEDASADEKIFRVKALVNAVKNLRLVVKGNLDDAEPLFIIGGIGSSKTHYFDHVTDAPERRLIINDDLKDRLNEDGYACALLSGDNFVNEAEIREKLKPKTMKDFFEELNKAIVQYYKE